MERLQIEKCEIINIQTIIWIKILSYITWSLIQKQVLN